MKILVGSVEIGRNSPGCLPFPASEEVRDAIASYAKQPGGDLLHRLHQPVSFNQFGEDVLQDVFSIALVPDPFADEIPQPWPFPLDRIRDLLVLVSHHPLFA